MTVSTTDNKVVYIGNDSITQFAYNYRMVSDDDMEVWFDEILQTTGYAVTRNPDNVGGVVDFITAPATGVNVTLLRVIDETQETDYTPYTAFPAESHEAALDKLTMIIQQHTEEFTRTIVAPIGEGADVDYTMPPYQAGSVIQWTAADPKELQNSAFPLDSYVTQCAESADLASISSGNAAQSANIATQNALLAEVFRDFSMEWAINPVDALVDDGTNPPDYSSYHYAQQSQDYSIRGVLSAIDEELTADAIGAVFIYDTSNDDDGGVWTDTAQSQSWFNETLNTLTRGATKKFPKVVAVVVTTATNRVKIYDLNNPNDPTWLEFNSSSVSNMVATPTSFVTMKNGVMYVGHAFGYYEIDFINDTGRFVRSVDDTTNMGKYLGNIAQRNDGLGKDTHNGWVISSTATYDCAVISDGEMNNTVYVAGDGGVDRITPDRTVSSWTDLGNAAKICKNIGILDGNEYVIWGASDNDNGYYIQIAPVNQPLVDSRFNNAATGYFHLSLAINGVWGADTLLVHYNDSQANLTALANNYIGTSQGLIRYYPNHEAYGNSMAALITTLFNSGIMHGDIRGAWLADTAITDLVETEIVTNGEFTSNITGWTDASDVGASIAWNASGYLDLISDGVGRARARQTLTTIVGMTYSLITNIQVGSLNLRLGTVLGTADIISTSIPSGVSNFSFKATTATVYLEFNHLGASTKQVNDISIKVADADRSYNNTPLQVFGTINRTPVASGADLVAYSGWSTINYLEQAYNSRLDFGTGDLYLMGWVKTSGSASEETIFDRRDTTGLGARISLSLIAPSQFLRFRIGATDLITSNIINDGKLHFIVAFRNSGVSYIYIDGVLNTSGANTDDATNVTAVSRVGITWANTAQMQGDMALLRMGGGFPTDEQIKQIYEHEKPLFNENAKCLLQGSLSNANAVDISESDNVLTVCSGDHITRFNDLVVVSDEATVATSVSRGCGNKEVLGS